MKADPAAKFECPTCGHETVSRVLETRLGRRRRECTECGGTFTTQEVIVRRDRERQHHARTPFLPFETTTH